MLRKTRLLLTLLVLWLVLTLLGCSRKSDGPRQEVRSRFNVVLVVSDALRADVIGCYGGEARTPNLDKLAEQGVLFESAYTTSPWTPPAAVSIFTGNYATSYPSIPFEKTIKIQVPDEETLLAEVLVGIGYDAVIMNESVHAGLHNCLQGLTSLTRDRRVVERQAIRDLINARIHSHGTALILDYLLTVPDHQNFFVAHWILDPHEPFSLNKFARKIAVNESMLTKPLGHYTSRSKIAGELNEEESKYLKARYIAEVESVDERIGHIRTVLEHRQLLERTYFVFTSDHGELFGEHDLYGHGVNYFEELVRVPLLVSGPGLPTGKRIRAAVSLVGLMKTLKELLGVEYADSMQGASFKHLIFGETGTGAPLYFDDVREHKRVDALLEDSFKLVALRDGTMELYDLSNDPGEISDVTPRHRDRARKMMERIVALRGANAERRAFNLDRLDGSEHTLSDEESEELRKKLRALGYIQ
jgi:choline-sulfatase